MMTSVGPFFFVQHALVPEQPSRTVAHQEWETFLESLKTNLLLFIIFLSVDIYKTFPIVSTNSVKIFLLLYFFVNENSSTLIITGFKYFLFTEGLSHHYIFGDLY